MISDPGEPTFIYLKNNYDPDLVIYDFRHNVSVEVGIGFSLGMIRWFVALPKAIRRLADQIYNFLIEEPKSEGWRHAIESRGIDIVDQEYLRNNYYHDPSVFAPIKRDLVEKAAVLHYLTLNLPNDLNLPVGRKLIVTLRLTPDERPGSVPLEVPVGALELTLFVRAPGFHLEGEHPRTVAIPPDLPFELSLPLELIPVASGAQTVSLEVYAGKRGTDVAPARLSRTVAVATPLEPLNLPELIERRLIPTPQPDVTLYVTLEEAARVSGRQQMRFHLTCPSLGLDRERLERPLSLTEHDLAALRRAAVWAAAGATDAAPPDALAGLRAFGESLFNQLMPPGHELYDHFKDILRRASSDVPLSWLILADDRVLLPWEMVFAHEFFARAFVLAHWVLGQGLVAANEAPLGAWT